MEVESRFYSFLQRASASGYLRAIVDDRIPSDAVPALELTRQMFLRTPGFRMQLIVDLQAENASHYKALMGMGAKVRHLDRNKVNFALVEGEYLSATLSAIEEQVLTGAAIPNQAVWSSSQDVVSQAEQVFEVMWRAAEDGEARIRQLEEGVEPETTLLIDDMNKVYEIGTRMVDECSEEALMIVASEKTITRNRRLFERLAERQKRLGFSIRILAPNLDRSATEVLPLAAWRRMEGSINMSILIYDRKRMFLTQYSRTEADTTEQAVSTNIYTTSKPTIAGMVSLFNAFWGETELREREQKTRKQAELLQDILTHDIRNYNQILTFNVDMLRTELDGATRARILDLMTRTLNDSGSLIERAKKLGKIASQEDVRLHPVNIGDSLERSLRVIRQSHPDKRIEFTCSLDPEALALSDELLDEVFVNILSNSVKYTQGETVPIEVRVEARDADTGDAPATPSKAKYWRITVADHGAGVQDGLKEKVFRRYLDGAMGSGLGLAIVRALVVDRYLGDVMIRDRVPGRREEGATVELWLQRG